MELNKHLFASKHTLDTINRIKGFIYMRPFNIFSVAFIYLMFIFFPTTSILAAGIDKKGNNVDTVLAAYEQKLETLGKQLAESRYNDGQQDSLNKLLLRLMDEALRTNGAYKYAFDSLTQISKVQSANGDVKLFTWFTLTNNNKFTYFGYLTYYLKTDKKLLVYQLNDAKESITNPENQVLTNQNWYGVLYYELLENKSANGPIYTLIGWDGRGAFSNSKVIDILTFTESGKPKFGKAVFKVGKKKDKRLIFEYNKRASMLITYDDRLKMIVFDHLAPINSSSNKNNEFLGPDLSYDGLKYIDESWEYQSDVDYKPSKRSKKTH